MDRFVTRTPTWKTLNYTSMAAQSVFQKKCVPNKTTADNKKKPFQGNQLTGVAQQSYDFDKRIVDVLSSNQANDENFNGNSNDSGLSSASSISPQQTIDKYNENAYNKGVNNNLGKLSDYIDCPDEKENDSCVTITRTLKSHTNKIVETGLRVQQTLGEVKQKLNPESNKTPEKAFLKTSNMIMARIQRDLNSPSAAARVKAIRAMKSPTKSAYNQFDISETEKSFRLPEPPSMEEIMRNIVVYVEVRSGEDNRSAGVRKVIEALGARVCLSINRETTHVIFKDGLLSTFKKATQMNIPIVSILWIEACKNQRRICDPKDFPISNLDRYENPELYNKMKRVKSMQPDSECNKRIRNKPCGTPKESTPNQKTGNLKKTSTAIGSTPTSSINKKKTDISQFFKKIERPTPTSTSKTDCDTNSTKAIITDSPATQLLNRIQSENYTPLKTAIRQDNNVEDSDMETANASEFRVGAAKTINFQQENSEENIEARIKSNIFLEIKTTTNLSPLPKTSRRTRRQSLMADCEIETTTISMNTMAISVSTPSKTKNRRRSSIHAPKDMSLANKTPKEVNSIETISEESNDLQQKLESSKIEKEQENQTKSTNRRRTLYTVQTMEQTNLLNSETETSKEMTSAATKSSRRRTLYSRETMETSELYNNNYNNKVVSNTPNRRRTCLNFKTIEQTDILETSNRNKKQTNEVKINTPKSNKPTNPRRTLFEAKSFSDTNIQALSPNITSGNSICLTPTIFQKGGVASSTLLDDNDCRSSLVATPPADATTGKLLEETEKCATPLIFSSTRKPGSKRRTLFDVSMDVITQRLQCINQSARRSLVPPAPAADVVSNVEMEISTPIYVTKNNQLPASSAKKPSKETLDECGDKNDIISRTSAQTTNKRRKLFMPNDILNTPPTTATPCSLNTPLKAAEEDNLATLISKKNATNSVTKRRRTLMPISQPQSTTTGSLSETKSITAITPTVRKRRSTLDFEQVQNINSKQINNVKDVPTESSEITVCSQQISKPKKTRVLVYTNMHQQQIDVIREAIDKLGLFVLESCVTNSTTHLVSLEPRRTLNLLRALSRGLWVLDYSWILESLKAGKWLPEESHELRDFSRAIEVCRSEREAFGCNYKCDLFRKIGAFFVSSSCCPISKENMCELINLCGGQVVNARKKARYIIGDSNRTLEDKLYLTPYWILDSITQMQIMKVNKYLYPLTTGKSASQPIPLERSN